MSDEQYQLFLNSRHVETCNLKNSNFYFLFHTYKNYSILSDFSILLRDTKYTSYRIKPLLIQDMPGVPINPQEVEYKVRHQIVICTDSIQSSISLGLIMIPFVDVTWSTHTCMAERITRLAAFGPRSSCQTPPTGVVWGRGGRYTRERSSKGHSSPSSSPQGMTLLGETMGN